MWKFIKGICLSCIVGVVCAAVIPVSNESREDITMIITMTVFIGYLIVIPIVNKAKYEKLKKEYTNHVKENKVDVATKIIPALKEKGFKVVDVIYKGEFITKLAIIDPEYDKYKVLIYNIADDSLYDSSYENQTNIVNELDTINDSINAPRISVGVLF